MYLPMHTPLLPVIGLLVLGWVEPVMVAPGTPGIVVTLGEGLIGAHWGVWQHWSLTSVTMVQPGDRAG